MIMNNFPWFFKKLFEPITVQTTLPEQSSIAIVVVVVRCAWHHIFDKKIMTVLV